MNTSRPGKAVFTVYVNEGFTEPVEPSLPEFDDDKLLLDLDWSSDESYSTNARDQFAPMAYYIMPIDLAEADANADW